MTSTLQYSQNYRQADLDTELEQSNSSSKLNYLRIQEYINDRPMILISSLTVFFLISHTLWKRKSTKNLHVGNKLENVHMMPEKQCNDLRK